MRTRATRQAPASDELFALLKDDLNGRILTLIECQKMALLSFNINRLGVTYRIDGPALAQFKPVVD